MFLALTFATLIAAEGHALSHGASVTSAASTATVIPRGGWQYPRTALSGTTSPRLDTSVTDPYAPRADAPVLRLRQTATPPAQTDAATQPARAGGARYYSIHRQAGRRPDAPTLPAPVYLDALPVQLNNLPQGADLAAPAAPPLLMRDAQGRLRPVIQDDPVE